ncbi:hypothetical protein H5410_014442 [Solanum commersonii]|uniref:Cupin type-1 domain-containing protein n=1 Tax=Solanum commersonii TaxID=4109 RepID=A0A9J5ZRD8_SOLCO|nr:hypothetical protein H5410_014442 [Solanum commersonii]
MHIGFISMESNSLVIPQYLDSNLVIFVHHGEAKVGHIYKDQLEERSLKPGDVYTIPAGSAFYLENRSFFIGGGSNPSSILAGFDHTTLSTALNVSVQMNSPFLTSVKKLEVSKRAYSKLEFLLVSYIQKYTRSSGPIVHLSGSHDTNTWSNFLDLEPHQRLSHLKRIVNFDEEANPKEEKSTWSFRKFVFTLLNAPSIYNLYNKKPDIKNDYRWSKKVDSSDYSPLEQWRGSLMAPHINPSAIEYGIVLRGTGRIQIVYPNGTLAMNAKVREGCFLGAKPVGVLWLHYISKEEQSTVLGRKNSLMQSLRRPEFAAAFGIDEKRLKRIANAQREQVILPSHSSEDEDGF